MRRRPEERLQAACDGSHVQALLFGLDLGHNTHITQEHTDDITPQPPMLAMGSNTLLSPDQFL